MQDLAIGNRAGIAVLAAYAALMLLVGWWSIRGRKTPRRSMGEYYLAGRGLGAVVLFFTFYATQYSGNTLVGYAPAAYRQGFPWWQSVWFFTAVVAAYLAFAPRLYVVARREGFVTPTDWIRYRFRSEALTLASAILMIWALGNYLLEQLVAIGQGVSGLTGDAIPYQAGVLVFVGVMVTYSWLGGMRAVALTDVVQGTALFVGVLALTLGGLSLIDWDLGAATRHLLNTRPALVAVPPLEVSLRWLSLVVIVALGASVYPHAIQRIYAAESERTLKRALGRMALMPPLTAGLVFVVGIVGVVLFPDLDAAQSEQLVGMIANRVAALGLPWLVAMLLLFGGVVAAIVSTADSALLSLSSLISRDLYARFVAPGAEESRLVWVGKLCSLAVVGALLVVAWHPPATLLRIFVLKLELLVQLAPAVFLGLYWSRLAARPVLLGMLAGAGVAGAVTLFDLTPPLGLHGGLVGLAANLLISVGGSFVAPARGAERSTAEEMTDSG